MGAFTVHIDDSGTDPKQKVAIGSGLIIPATRIAALEKEWATLAEKHGFADFHMSECVARNPKSDFAGWDDAKQEHVISRVRQIGKKFGVKAFSLAVEKLDYDELMPDELRHYSGNHYTWTIRSLIDALDKWAAASDVTLPFEYIYDWMDPKTQKEAKDEIDTVMAQAEELAVAAGKPGRYANYSFRRRQDIPALQCTDALAWTCYQYALFAHEKIPLKKIAQDCWNDYEGHQGKTWLLALGIKREVFKEWMGRIIADGRTLERFKEWEKTHGSKQRKKP